MRIDLISPEIRTVNLTYGPDGSLVVNDRAAKASRKWFVRWMVIAPAAFSFN